MERNHYICIPVIDIDSVLKIDKRAYPQAYLEQCKYKLKKRKIVNYIDDETIDEDSESDYNDTVDSDYNDTIDSYVKIKNNFIDSKNIYKIVTITDIIMKKFTKNK